MSLDVCQSGARKQLMAHVDSCGLMCEKLRLQQGDYGLELSYKSNFVQ